MSARYLTTTLPYVNADPHIGFALELVQADALVRAWRERGEDVFFNTGTDEHGQKIFEAAKKAGREVQEYVDHYATEFRKLKEALNLDKPNFIRTTEARHIEAAQEIWRRCEKSGDIYSKEYEGLYCVGHEAFMTEKDLVDGKCPDHGTLPQTLKEKNYFFKFKKYEEYLLEYLGQSDPVIPEWRRQEAINFVTAGLEDFSISREKARLSWGISVPGDDSQVMYVWFDALTSYISTLGWPADPDGNFEKYWANGNPVQMAGKDQIRFQSLMWQAMLKSAGLPATSTVFYHGFITSGGQKMSKTIGNVISPYDLVKKYGTEATRYLLLRHVHSTEDSDVTWEKLDEWYTADLVNGIGNLVARIMQMSNQYFDVPIDISDRREAYSVKQWLDKFEFQNALIALSSDWSRLDGDIQQQKPFEVFKTDKERAKLQVSYLVKELSRLTEALEPFMPATAKKIHQAIKENKKPENLFPRLAEREDGPRLA